jgi:hypothetical protein
MAGFFSGTGSNRELGRVWRAVSNNGLGSQAQLRANCAAYYGIGGTVSLSSTFGGRFYPFTY